MTNHVCSCFPPSILGFMIPIYVWNPGFLPFSAFFGIKCLFFHQTLTLKSHFRPSYLRPKNSEKLRIKMRQSRKKNGEIFRVSIPAHLEYSGVLSWPSLSIYCTISTLTSVRLHVTEKISYVKTSVAIVTCDASQIMSTLVWTSRMITFPRRQLRCGEA